MTETNPDAAPGAPRRASAAAVAALTLLLQALVGCSSPSWGGETLEGVVHAGRYTHPSGAFSVWAPWSDTTDVRREREWQWLFHEEFDDAQGFLGVSFGPAFLDVSVFSVSLRPVSADRPTAEAAFDALCKRHNGMFRLGTALLHDAQLDLGGVPTGFRVYAYAGHDRWTRAGEADVTGHAVYYHQRRAGQDVFFMLDVPASLEASLVPISPGTLIDEAWDKQRRFVRSFELYLQD